MAINFMTENAYVGVNYQLKSIIDELWGFYWAFYMSGDADAGFELWKKNYEVYELEVEGVAFYFSTSELMNQYREFRDIIGYQVGDRCPCRFRDGFSAPVPVCP